MRSISEVTKAISNVDLSQTVNVDVQGEMLDLKTTVPDSGPVIHLGKRGHASVRGLAQRSAVAMDGDFSQLASTPPSPARAIPHRSRSRSHNPVAPHKGPSTCISVPLRAFVFVLLLLPCIVLNCPQHPSAA